VTVTGGGSPPPPPPPTPQSDLSVTMQAAPEPVFVGHELTYTITVQNAGPANATSVALVDAFPSSLTYVSATPTQGTCAQPKNVECALGSIASGGTAKLILVGRARGAGTVTNAVQVALGTTAQVDPTPANNVASTISTVQTPALTPPPPPPPPSPGPPPPPPGPKTPPSCVVPKVVGQTFKAAKRKIVAAHCKVGKVKHAASTRVPRGTVSAQSPKAGKKLAGGSKVNVTVSLGRARK
jgi:uncharacterized repeat protein (TIGR01451 family)